LRSVTIRYDTTALQLIAFTFDPHHYTVQVCIRWMDKVWVSCLVQQTPDADDLKPHLIILMLQPVIDNLASDKV